ncbi:MAG: diacylglycerol/lipid kinase family protein, partial [Dongiaceae bacterium]
MSRIGIIINPRSQQNRRGLAGLRAILMRHSDAVHVEIESIEQIPQALADFAARGVELVGISGGDGTVQAVITALLNGRAFEQPPAVAVLPAGMTNLIAANVGLQGRPDRALSRLLQGGQAGAAPGRHRKQSLLTLRRTPDAEPIHGLFLGTAVFHRMVMMAIAEVHPLGVERHLAVAFSIALSVLRLMSRYRRANSLWHGDRINLQIDDQTPREREYLLFLATTLEHLIMGLIPFWGNGDGQLRYTSIDYPVERLGRALWPLIRGQPRSWFPAAGYHSGRVQECRLELTCPIVFDGEFITPEPGTPVVVRSDRLIKLWLVKE